MPFGVVVFLLLGTLLLNAGSPTRSSAAPAPAAAPAVAFPTVRAIAATNGGAPVYLAAATGLYRASQAPFTRWVRQNAAGSIVALSPIASELVYATREGDLYRSTDYGVTATRRARGLNVTTLARSIADPAVIYATGGTGSTGTLYKSSDDGRTWAGIYTTPEASPGISSLNAIALDPRNAAHLFLAEGLYHGGAVIESTDGGSTWNTLPDPAGTGLEQPGVLAIDPAHPAVLWAAWNLMGNGGLYRSADSGRHWQQLPSPPLSHMVVTDVAFDTAHSRVYLAAADQQGGQGRQIFVTADDGATFQPAVSRSAELGGRLVVLGTAGYLLAGDPATPLFVAPLLPNGAAGPPLEPAVVTNTAATPVVVRVFIGSSDGSLYAVNGANGSPLWTFHTGGAAASPLVSQGSVYAGSFDGNLYALDAVTGATLWRFHTGGAVSAPVASSDLVSIGSRDKSLYILKTHTGALLYRIRTAGEVGTPATDAGTVYAGSSDHRLYAVSLQTGLLRWRYDGGASFLPYTVTAAGGLVYAGTYNGYVYALAAKTGALLWRFQATTASSVPGPATVGGIANGLLYVGSADHHIYALDARTGKLAWHFTTRGPVQSIPAVSRGIVYAGSWDGNLYALDARTGSLHWRVTGSGAIYGSARAAAGSVFVDLGGHSLVALDALNGLRQWHFGGDAFYTMPAVQTPAGAVAPSSTSSYFAQTGHTLAGAFLAFWQRYGGLKTFGYPITEPFPEAGRLVQYTERFAMAINSGSTSVHILPLGTLRTADRHFTAVPPPSSTDRALYFTDTRHTLSGRFLTFWRAHYARTLLGAPVAEVTIEGNGDGTGRRYQVQWFQNGRLEYHPELAGTPYEMEIGLVGTQMIQARGWLT